MHTSHPLHAVLAVSCAALTCHMVFKRWEPRSLLAYILFFVLEPTLLTTLLLPHMSGISSAAPLTFAIYYSSLVASILAYRLSPFHPLAKYPGPLLCRVSKLWFAAIAMKGKQHLYYYDLHQRFGDVVRIGPNELSFRDVNAIVPMMGSQGMPKGPWWDGRVPDTRDVRPLLALRDPDEHARRRRAWNRAFSTLALKDYQVLIDARISQLVDILGTKVGTSVDLSKWLGWLTLDIMNDVMFGGGGDAMEFEDRDDLSRLLINAQPMALLMSHVPWIGVCYLWIPSLGKGLRTFRNYAAQRASTRKAHGSQHKDVFYHLIDEAGVEPAPPSSAQVASDGGLAIVAGAETTSTTLAHVFWLLLANPTAYRRLQAEVDEPGRNGASQARMPYLNAVINEALRLFPAVLSGSQRAPLIGSGGKTIGHHFVPEGTSAVVHTYSLHRDPRYFSPAPHAFIPERWLPAADRAALEPRVFGAAADAAVVHNTAAFIPFSVGPSNCAGRNLAYQEMRAAVCALLSRFELRFDAGFDVASWEENLCDYFVVQRGRLPVVLTARRPQ